MRYPFLAPFSGLLLILICTSKTGAREFDVGDSPVPASCEGVMRPHTKITAINPDGIISITSGSGLKRTYTWDGQSRSVEMWPRIKPWMGVKGLYYPGEAEHWKPVEGITRGVLQEGIQNFKSKSAALKWLNAFTGYKYKAYRNDGLCVWWDKTPDRRQLNVDVFQILVRRKKPDCLKGASDDAISVKKTTPSVAQF